MVIVSVRFPRDREFSLRERSIVLRAWTRPKQEGHARPATTVGCLHVLRQRRRKRRRNKAGTWPALLAIYVKSGVVESRIPNNDVVLRIMSPM